MANQDKLQTAKNLAKSHFAIEPNMKRIFLLEPLKPQDPEEPIKLLEVVEGTIERGIEPVGFTADPDRGIDYPSVIVEVSPSEYEEIAAERMSFGDRSWSRGVELWPN